MSSSVSSSSSSHSSYSNHRMKPVPRDQRTQFSDAVAKLGKNLQPIQLKTGKPQAAMQAASEQLGQAHQLKYSLPAGDDYEIITENAMLAAQDAGLEFEPPSPKPLAASFVDPAEDPVNELVEDADTDDEQDNQINNHHEHKAPKVEHKRTYAAPVSPRSPVDTSLDEVIAASLQEQEERQRQIRAQHHYVKPPEQYDLVAETPEQEAYQAQLLSGTRKPQKNSTSACTTCAAVVVVLALAAFAYLKTMR